MFLVGLDQSDLKVAIVMSHVVALVEVYDPSQALTQDLTTGQVADDVQSFYSKMTRDEAMQQMRAGLV